jgi:predicted tellurium resistance membrane protein TerC
LDFLFSAESWAALLTLTVLEIVLGIDNIVFISILAGKLPVEKRSRARTLGLVLAMGTRILLLFSLTWIMRLTRPLFAIGPQEISGRDLIMLLGGMFLLWKSTTEIHERLEGATAAAHKAGRRADTMASVLTQIALLDIVFSLDSVITAVGMAKEVEIMIAAIVISVGIMMWTSGPLGDFVERHPTIKMLALSFLLLIGMALVAEGFHQHIPKGYIYFAMGFSVFVEMLNLRARRASSKPVHLRHSKWEQPEWKPPQK